MRTATAAMSVGLLCATLVACGSNREAVSDTVRRTSAPTPAPSKSRHPSTDDPQAVGDLTYAAPPDSPMPLGEAWQWTGTTDSGAKATGTTAVLLYKQHMPPKTADERLRYDQVRVRVCSTTGTPITVSRRFFALIRPSGGVNTTQMVSPDPRTAFPSKDTVLGPGQCTAGTIDFLGVRGESPLLAVWGPDGAPKPAVWVISQ